MRRQTATLGPIVGLAAALSFAAPIAAQGPPEPKVQFVGGLRQLLEATAGQYGDEGPGVLAAIESMRVALVRWDAGIDAYERQAASEDESAGLHVSLGLMYLDRRRIDDALNELDMAARLDTTTADIRTLQAFAYGLTGRTAETTRALTEAAALDPRSPAAAYRLAQHLMKVGRGDRAVPELERFRTLVWRVLTESPGAEAAGVPFARVDLLREAPGVAPIFPPALYASGFESLRDGRYDEAVVRFSEAAALDPLVASPIAASEEMRRGAAALRQGQLAAAIAHLRSAVESAAGEAEAHRMLGMAYWADEQYDNSVDQLQAAIRLRPDDERARVALGAALEAGGRLTEAEQAFKDAIQAVPVSGQAHYRLGGLYQSQRWSDALRALRSAADLNPVVGLDPLFQTMVRAALAQPDFDAAIGAAVRRIEVNPNNPEAHRSLADIYVQQGYEAEALAEYSAALLIDRQDADAYSGLAQGHVRAGRYADALDAGRRAVAIDPHQRAAQFALASALVRLGRREEGARELETFRRLQAQAQAAERRDLELKMLRQEAMASLARGDDDEALEAFRQVVAYEPAAASDYLSFGLVLKQVGRHAEAIEQFEKALELRADPDVCRVLADSHEALGHLAESRAYRELYAQMKAERLRKAGWNR